MLFFMKILQLFCVIGATESNTFNAKRYATDRGGCDRYSSYKRIIIWKQARKRRRLNIIVK